MSKVETSEAPLPLVITTNDDQSPLTDSKRIHVADKKFCLDVSHISFENRLFLRAVAKDRHFEHVNFKYCIFDTCYFRDCNFDSCDFTGSRFMGTIAHGSHFSGCIFNYCSFERTLVDPDILDYGCPAYENLKMRFARTLRINYQQLGDAQSVNKAIGIELQATEIHLYKAWKSNESYYRKKYKGWKRVRSFFQWCSFEVLDKIWGNGESLQKLIRATSIIIIFIALGDVYRFKDPRLIDSYLQALHESPQIFLGTLIPPSYSDGSLTLTLIVFIRLVMFGFFMSIIIKKFNRR